MQTNFNVYIIFGCYSFKESWFKVFMFLIFKTFEPANVFDTVMSQYILIYSWKSKNIYDQSFT